jgi:rhodanese-related sulfurtransferase
MEPTTATELVARLNVVFPNVSLADENGRGQLPSAVNVPLRKLEQRIAELPREYEIAGYCRGPNCVLSFEAMDAPRSRGFNVRRIGEGFPEWKAAGVPIEVVA